MKVKFEYYDCNNGYDWEKDRTIELSEAEITLLLKSDYINYQVGSNTWKKMYVNNRVTSIDEYGHVECAILLNTRSR